jgi:predicted lipid-binding transport protein (Tim44 family)
MKKRHVKLFSIVVAALLVSATVFETSAFARAGGGRSFGSRGSRSYSLPSRSYQQPFPTRQQTPPSPPPYQPSPSRQQSGSFLRSLGGGILGGFLGGMLFRSLGFGSGGMAGHGRGGIGLFEILLLCGIGYLIYRFVKKRRQEAYINQAPPPPPPADFHADTMSYAQSSVPPDMAPGSDPLTGLNYIRQMDASFDENRFRDLAMDIFFRIQGAWMNRELSPVTAYLNDEMRRILQEDVDRLLREKKINRLENIAVRNTDLVEAWQESGEDFITVRFYANLLDYTMDEMGTLIEGNRTEPVKFEEFWTFTRPVGTGNWKLCAISQG